MMQFEPPELPTLLPYVGDSYEVEREVRAAVSDLGEQPLLCDTWNEMLDRGVKKNQMCPVHAVLGSDQASHFHPLIS